MYILPQFQKTEQQQGAEEEGSPPGRALFPSVLAWTSCFGSPRIGILRWMWLVYHFRGDKY